MQTQVNAIKLIEELEDFLNKEVPLNSQSTLVDTGQEVFRRKAAAFLQYRKAQLSVRTA